MGRIIHAITAALNLGNDADIHITLLCEFFLGEFFFASRLADGVASFFFDILRLFRGVVAGAF